ncbi:MAG: hemerythrin domain-containing protein [Dysgonamonadaceae bacterium]|nr:hemerythrin domain-containing protein [Dysgonamonadaceae bacterium]
MKMLELIEENQFLLLALQHFGIDFAVGDKSVVQICAENSISENLFLIVANLYNGYRPKSTLSFSSEEIRQIVSFLKNNHDYYRNDKYPEISSYIRQLQENHSEEIIFLLEKFFNEYFNEVMDHFAYEDNVAFPYFLKLTNKSKDDAPSPYSAHEYLDHHSDIRIALGDLKSLLFKHININGDPGLRRKLLFSLFELEFDLHVHSLIEENILIPVGYNIERSMG